MDVTTTAATIGVMIRRQYCANRPSTPSMQPPTMMAPAAAPMPYVATTPVITVTNVKLMPMTMGSPLPKRPMGNSWISVPMPAMSMADLNHPARFRIAKAGHAGNDHDRRQVRHEHGQDMLDAIGHRTQNRYVAVEFQQLIVVERLQMRAHRRNSISPVSGSMACTMASDSR